MQQEEIIIDGKTFLMMERSDLDTRGFLFDPGTIYVCPLLLERFDRNDIFRRISAHARREVGEYNRWLMTDEELENIESSFRIVMEMNRPPELEELMDRLGRLLPLELFWIIDALYQDHEVDMKIVERELPRHLSPADALSVYELIDSYVNPKEEEILEQREEFWNIFVQDEKDIDAIENEETIDSFFLDQMVIMTTPHRKATIIYMDSMINNIDTFYELDRLLAA